MATKEAIEILRAAAPRDSLDDGPAEQGSTRRVNGCVVVPLMNTGEETFAGQIVEANYLVRTPPRTDIKATDRVRLRGEVCEVLGAPADYGHSGVLFQARRVGSD